MKINLALVSLFLFAFAKITAQQPFIAGQVNANITYTDVVPDSFVTILPATVNAFDHYDLDIDYDGLPDFVISIASPQLQTDAITEVTLWGLGINEVIIVQYDTIFPAPQNPLDTLLFYPLAKPFEQGEEISPGDTSTSEIIYLYRSWFNNDWMTFNPLWAGIGARYAGLKRITANDTVLCWLKLEVLDLPGYYGGEWSFVVMDHAIDEPYLNDVEKFGLSASLSVRPNPANESILLLTGDDQGQKEILIYDSHGRQIYCQYIHGKETMIDVSTWPPGIYLAVVYEDGLPVGRAKFVVR